MTVVKICGLTNIADAVAAARAGADMLGFVFYERSPRAVKEHIVREITNELPAKVRRVGVFVDEEIARVLEIAENCGLDTIQLHGTEAPDYCRQLRADAAPAEYTLIKALPLVSRNALSIINAYETDYYMLDAYSPKARGGTGTTFDWTLIDDFEFLHPIFISGGLTPANVGEAIKRYAPYGVDVSSGVESAPGKKDIELIEQFIKNVRKAQ